MFPRGDERRAGELPHQPSAVSGTRTLVFAHTHEMSQCLLLKLTFLTAFGSGEALRSFSESLSHALTGFEWRLKAKAPLGQSLTTAAWAECSCSSVPPSWAPSLAGSPHHKLAEFSKHLLGDINEP